MRSLQAKAKTTMIYTEKNGLSRKSKTSQSSSIRCAFSSASSVFECMEMFFMHLSIFTMCEGGRLCSSRTRTFFLEFVRSV